eukprot:Seg83.6 transcript_id=Seg83.6/GoldUCD/mRNA.D3Y31 product="hypothetical protein" protein_id=Seg83.6/GoldUCD/D3Y31
MADLPSDRMQEAPPFPHCAVDYFGPFYIKEKRKELKRYGCLFTCLTSRAVHIEVSHTLETDSFIMALRRFINIRGNIRQLRSDWGTNFVGAERELRDAVKEMDHDRIKRELIIFSSNGKETHHQLAIWVASGRDKNDRYGQFCLLSFKFMAHLSVMKLYVPSWQKQRVS